MNLVFAYALMTMSMNAKLVSSKEQFVQHVRLHQQRVELLGLALAKEFYPDIDRESLASYLRMHDFAKTDADPQKFAMENGALDALYEFYGVPLKDSDRKRLTLVVSEINRIDREISSKLFSILKNVDEEKFQSIEKIADMVDRGLDPVAAEEFGRPMRRASEFLLGHEALQAEWLEYHYQGIVYKHVYNKCILSLKR